MPDTLFIVVPCYNEEEVLPETAKRLHGKLRELIDIGRVSGKSRILLVNDGSRDRTWEIIRALHEQDALFSGITLSRNRGHQNALLAGLMTARKLADVTISMDADLQDDIGAADGMLDEYYKGSDIVYGVRSSRRKDSFFKRFTAEGFYKLINSMGGEIVFNHADYRLMSRRALDALAEYSEVNLFLRGVVPMIGFKTSVVEYERGERFAGESKYSMKKMMSFALEGITSLSDKPLKLISGLGAAILIIDFLLLLAFIIGRIMGHDTLHAVSILLLVTLAMGGLILLSLGVVGEYIGKIYLETKNRPRYFIDETLHK